MITFSNICGINGKFYIKFEHNLCIIKINECLVAKTLLTNVTKTNEHSNITTFVHALLCDYIDINRSTIHEIFDPSKRPKPCMCIKFPHTFSIGLFGGHVFKSQYPETRERYPGF